MTTTRATVLYELEPIDRRAVGREPGVRAQVVITLEGSGDHEGLARDLAQQLGCKAIDAQTQSSHEQQYSSDGTLRETLAVRTRDLDEAARRSGALLAIVSAIGHGLGLDHVAPETLAPRVVSTYAQLREQLGELQRVVAGVREAIGREAMSSVHDRDLPEHVRDCHALHASASRLFDRIRVALDLDGDVLPDALPMAAGEMMRRYRDRVAQLVAIEKHAAKAARRGKGRRRG